MLTHLKNEGLRPSIYSGDLYLLQAQKWSTRLQSFAKELITESLGENYRKAHETLDEGEFFNAIADLRRAIFTAQYAQTCVQNIILSLGEEANDFAFEPPKLRAVAHDGHLNPKAAPVYYGHRDTWYATPQATINLWIPLDDLLAEETFVFYPFFFERPIPNNSELFDYNNHALGRGWTGADEGLKNFFPTAAISLDSQYEKGFSITQDTLLIFSGSHYHRTLKQAVGTTRFSLDFRIVHLKDNAKKRGAPNVDNASKGSCLENYQRVSKDDRSLDWSIIR